MSTSAATKAQSWPGSSSQLASAAGTNVNLGAGVSLVSGTLDTPAALSIAQVAHGFAVGDAVYFNGTLWAKAQANAAATLGLALVASVPNANAFVAQFSGTISVPSASFTSGQYYFVSDASAGALTATAPTSSTSYSNPLLFATSSTTGIVLPFRPSALGPAIVWPGTASQLASGAGTAVTVGTSLALSGSTLATAIAAATPVATEQATGSNGSYVDLTTAGPAVTVTTGTSVIVLVSGYLVNNAASAQTGFVSVAVSGATTLAADDARSVIAGASGGAPGVSFTGAIVVTGLTAGSNTFTMKYKSQLTSVSFGRRNLIVIPL